MTKAEGSSPRASCHMQGSRHGWRERFKVMKLAHGPWGSHCRWGSHVWHNHNAPSLWSHWGSREQSCGSRDRASESGMCWTSASSSPNSHSTARGTDKRERGDNSLDRWTLFYSSHFDFSNKGVTSLTAAFEIAGAEPSVVPLDFSKAFKISREKFFLN